MSEQQGVSGQLGIKILVKRYHCPATRQLTELFTRKKQKHTGSRMPGASVYGDDGLGRNVSRRQKISSKIIVAEK